MSVRLRRLAADYERVRSLFQGEERIRLVEHHGRPPERYVLQYLVRSLQQDMASGTLTWADSFYVEINLPGAYPRTAPQCRMLTPAFHPNIAPHAICIGDHWAAGESLANLVVRIGEMLAYQSYNIKSPLNGHAAQWAERNRERLPIDRYDFSSILAKGEVTRANEETSNSTCANCGAHGDSGGLHVCMNGHVACKACLVPCGQCGKPMCLACSLERCEICASVLCVRCRARCATCGVVACVKDAARCGVCGQIHCRNCLVRCIKCNAVVCVNHMKKEKTDAGTAYLCDRCAVA